MLDVTTQQKARDQQNGNLNDDWNDSPKPLVRVLDAPRPPKAEGEKRSPTDKHSKKPKELSIETARPQAIEARDGVIRTRAENEDRAVAAMHNQVGVLYPRDARSRLTMYYLVSYKMPIALRCSISPPWHPTKARRKSQ